MISEITRAGWPALEPGQPYFTVERQSLTVEPDRWRPVAKYPSIEIAWSWCDSFEGENGRWVNYRVVDMDGNPVERPA